MGPAPEPLHEQIHELGAARQGWIQVARGTVTMGGETLRAGDGVAVAEPCRITLDGASAAEGLLFDMGPRQARPGA